MLFIFSEFEKLPKPKAMEPFASAAPIPPQRANKTANSEGSGVNPPKSTNALPPNLNNSRSTNQTKTGNVQEHRASTQKASTITTLVKNRFLLLLIESSKIWFNHSPPTSALRTTSITLSKWRKRRTTRIASLLWGSLLRFPLYLRAKPPTRHPILCLLHPSPKTERSPCRPETTPNLSKLTRPHRVYKEHRLLAENSLSLIF